MNLQNNNDVLLKIADQNGLDKHALASLLKVRLSTVEKWRMGKESSGYRSVKDGTLELLRLMVYVSNTVPRNELETNLRPTFVALKVGGLLK